MASSPDNKECVGGKLQKMQDNLNVKIKKLDCLSKHMNESMEQARSLKMKECLDKEAKFGKYASLTLPPVAQNQRMDSSLLQSHNLLIPKHFTAFEEFQSMATMTSEHPPQYECSTFSSRQMCDMRPQNDLYSPEKCHERSKPAKITVSKSKTSPRQKAHKPPAFKQLIDLSYMKTNFLKNPRFIQLKEKRESCGNQVSECFKASPSPVLFEDFQLGCIYEIKLELKNISSSCRQVRVLPPTTPSFRLGPGMFPQENGLVAPGMSCQFPVLFTPMSLADCADSIKVKVQSSSSFTVSLQALREKPILSLSKYLDCGSTLVNGRKETLFEVKNTGGTARFKVQSNNALAQTNGEDTLTIGPFLLTPALFEVEKNSQVSIKVLFSPSTVKRFSEEICVHCDNCTSQTYMITGCAEVVSVKMSYIQGGTRTAAVGETIDHSALQIAVFNYLYPRNEYSKEIHVESKSSVPLSYRWLLRLPCLTSGENTCETIPPRCFKIVPGSGTLRGNDVTKFKVFCHPTEFGQLYSVASLYLESIPMATNTVQDINPINISLKGLVQGFHVSVSPLILMFPGRMFVGFKYNKAVKLTNHSHRATHFQCGNIVTDSFNIEVFPQRGEISAGESLECLVFIEAKKPCKVNTSVDFEVELSLWDTSVNVKGEFLGPSVEFVDDVLDFGLMKSGTYSNKNFMLKNPSAKICRWQINIKPADVCLPFSIFPESGVLMPHKTQTVAVHFMPCFASPIHTYFCCDVVNGGSSYLPVHAEVQRPFVCLVKSSIEIKGSFINVPVSTSFEIHNTSRISAHFSWQNIDEEFVKVTFEPQDGILLPQQSTQIIAITTFVEQGPVNVFAVCNVIDMLHPVVVRFTTSVQGLSVSFVIPNMVDICNEVEFIRSQDEIDFGENIPLEEPANALFILQNNSAIETNFTVWPEKYFPARLPTPPKDERQLKSKRPLLMKTTHIGDYSSKTDQQHRRDFAQNVLLSGKGVAFVCTPSQGVLRAFERKHVTITAYADVWGEYRDSLICKVGDDVIERFPMRIEVVGCPLSFQTAKDRTPIIRFGVHGTGERSTSRKMRINNYSNINIRVDWCSYVFQPNDEQLVDLNVYIGEPFPLLEDDRCRMETDGVECEMETDDQHIKVVLDEHQGIRGDHMFYFPTTQVIVPGKGHVDFQVDFIPPEHVANEINYIGYALGYMSLNKKDMCDGVSMNRLDGLDVLPCTLNMTATVKHSKLHLTAVDDDESFCFELPGNELLNEERLQKTHRFVLRNDSELDLNFMLFIQHPFHVATKKMSLKAHKSTEVQVSFTIDREAVTSHQYSKRLSFQRKLEIKFNNGTYQSCTFTGVICFPCISVPETVVTANVCFVGGRRDLEFVIRNDSKIPLRWRVYKDDNCPDSSRHVFQLPITSGEIPGHKANSSEHIKKIPAIFSPRHNVCYECVVCVLSETGAELFNDEPIKITLIGEGTFNEASI